MSGVRSVGALMVVLVAACGPPPPLGDGIDLETPLVAEREAPGLAEAGPGMRRAVERLWWNRAEHIEKLALSREVRAQMDELAIAYIAETRASKAQESGFERFRQRLEARDWSGARESLGALGAAHAEPVVGQGELMIEVLQLLSPEQMDRLVETFPGLVSGPWISMRNATATGPRRAGPTRGPRSPGASE